MDVRVHPPASPVTLTTDLVPLIARQLRDQQALRTLATLLLLTREHYPIVSALLYETVVFDTDERLYAFLVAHDPGENNDMTAARRLEQLRRLKYLHLDEAPSTRTASVILRLADLSPLHRLFPSAQRISLHFNAIQSLPSRAPSSSYNTSKAALKIYESLRRLARPSQLTIIRPEVSACPAYREMHTYFLTAKSDRRSFFHSLADHWPELRRVQWGAVHMDEAYAVHGVLNVYDLPGCECVRNEAYDRDLFGCWLDWARVLEKPYPRIRALLRGESEAVRGLKGRLEADLGKLWAGEAMPDRAVFELGVDVVGEREDAGDSTE